MIKAFGTSGFCKGLLGPQEFKDFGGFLGLRFWGFRLSGLGS